MSEYKRWGDEAYELLKKIKGKGSSRKKMLLILLADACYSGESQTRLFRRLKGTHDYVSRKTHYNWLDKDESYRNAYNFLIGQEKQPGIALQAREREVEARVADGLAEMQEARLTLRLNSVAAVGTLIDGLDAEKVFVTFEGAEIRTPDNRSRIQSAKEILARSVDLMAGQQTGADESGVTNGRSFALPDLSQLSNTELEFMKRVADKLTGDTDE